MDNIVRMPLNLDILTKSIQDTLRIISHENWVDSTLKLACLLLDAKNQFSSNEKFANWFNQKQFHINEQDRAALINIGRHIEISKPILKSTRRRSWQHVWKDEIRLAYLSKTLQPIVKQQQNAKTVQFRSTLNLPKPLSNRAQIARDVILTNQNKTIESIAKEFHISKGVIVRERRNLVKAKLIKEKKKLEQKSHDSIIKIVEMFDWCSQYFSDVKSQQAFNYLINPTCRQEIDYRSHVLSSIRRIKTNISNIEIALGGEKAQEEEKKKYLVAVANLS